MKLITVVIDGAGQIHALGSRAPDLMARNIRGATGAAEIVHCQIPLPGYSTEQLCIEIENRLRKSLGNQPAAIPASAATITAVRRAVFQVTVVAPAIARIRTRVRRAAFRFRSALGLSVKRTRLA